MIPQRDVTYTESKIRSDSLWIKPIFETNHCNLPTKATEIKNTRSLRLGSLYNLQLQFYPKKSDFPDFFLVTFFKTGQCNASKMVFFFFKSNPFDFPLHLTLFSCTLSSIFKFTKTRQLFQMKMFATSSFKFAKKIQTFCRKNTS